MIGCRGKAKWFKTAGVNNNKNFKKKAAGVYSMIFKVPAHREGIVDSLDMYSVNRDNLPT